MPRVFVTRREALKLGAAGALPLLAASATPSIAAPETKPVLTVGIATLGFQDYTNRQLAEELAKEGVRTVQLFLNQSDSRYWQYNGRSDVSSLTAARCRKIADDYRSSGVSIHSVGVYTNLIHPDEAERKANLAYFNAMMDAGAAMGVRTFVTETGHWHSDKPAPAVPYHLQTETWKRMVATGQELARMAAGHDATVLFEAFYNGFLASAKRTRMFIEEVGSPRIRALLDPANLLEMNDLEEMFQQLHPWIDCMHAKDRKRHVDAGVAAGQGDLDYLQFVSLAAKFAPHSPLVLEYVGAANYKPALAHLRKALAQAGLKSTIGADSPS